MRLRNIREEGELRTKARLHGLLFACLGAVSICSPSPAQVRARTVDLGLTWLANHQDRDGKWDADGFTKHDPEDQPTQGTGNGLHDVGVTGLAIMAFLGDGSTIHKGTYRSEIRRGVEWLVAQQQTIGLVGKNAAQDFIYDHSIATLALCEAYGLSGREPALLEPAQEAIDYLEFHRNPSAVWHYQPRVGSNDTSVTVWAVMAMKSAQDHGLAVEDKTLENAAAWLDRVTDDEGRVGYSQKGDFSSSLAEQQRLSHPLDQVEALTAGGLFCRLILGQNPEDHRTMEATADLLVQKLPRGQQERGTVDYSYWFFGTMALYQMGGPRWRTWSRSLTDNLVRTQHAEGSNRGSWDPDGTWGEDGGRVYSTAMMVLTSLAYYRYTRLIR